MYALELEKAFERLSDDDPRPLLVVRECNLCKGTDDALLDRSLDNEKTLILSRWFHCVKLKHHVLEREHTFNKLFEGKRPPHLFLASADGSNMTPMPGTQSQSDLWRVMYEQLAREYDLDARKAVKGIFKVLADYDMLDSQEDQIREQIDVEIEKRGPRSQKLKRLSSKLAQIEAKKDDAQAREKQLGDLALKTEKVGKPEKSGTPD